MKKIGNILFLYFFVFIMCIGASFAWYAWKGADIQVNVNFAGLDPYIKYTATTITGEDGITPSDTYSGGISNDITFNKEAEGSNLQVYGHVYLEINSASSEEVFKASNLKWTLVSVTNSVETEISTGNFVGELVNNKIPAYINFPLNSNSNTTYKAYIWIDNNAPLNRDISNESISVNIYSEASTIGSDNEGKYNELYIREIIYQNSIINSIKLYSSIYEITDYLITNTNDIPSVESTEWISVTSTTSSTEPGYIASINNINHSMNEINNICIKNSNGDVSCKSIGKYLDTINLTYDCTTNGGTTENISEDISPGTSLDLTKTCSKDGWTFVGWNTDKDATTKLDSYTVPSTDTTLYGIYKKDSITYTAYTKRNVDSLVTGDDTTVSCTINEVYNNTTQATSCNITLPNNPYTFTDWEFNGWVSSDTSTTTTSETSGSISGSSLTLTSNINLIATWKRDYIATFYTYTNNQTSTCTAYNNNICTFTLPDITTIEGPDSSTYQGVSTSISDTTTTTTYNSTYLNYYSVYIGAWTATYTKENDNVSSIGKTTDTCESYKYYDGSTYTSTTCDISLPDITPINGYMSIGWYDSENSKIGEPLDSITLTSNVSYIAKTRKLTSTDFSYDDTETDLNCDDVQCAIDSLSVILRELDPTREGTLFYQIASNATLDTSIDFSAISSDTNGKGVYELSSTQNDTYPIYYYRGAVTNNNVIFANFCWKIVRTTETAGIKLIYNGTPSNGQCNNTGTSSQLSSNSAFNSTATYNAHVGYMYGTANSSSYAAEHANTNPSTIKTAIDTWYQNNMTSYTSKLEDTVWCNDRSLTSGNGYGTGTYKASTTNYSAYNRLNTNKAPSLACSQTNDKFTVITDNGNGVLTYPVGLLTADEIAYAGAVVGSSNTNSTFYLYTGQNWWTASPSNSSISIFSRSIYNFSLNSNGYLINSKVSSTYGVRPAISLAPGTKYSSGSGAASDPYIVS